jgi:pimeloyl-ACP methyl ester carboxylesterase
MLTAASLKTVQTPLLNVAYFDTGPSDAPVAMLIHGWPDDPVSWSAVADGLAQAGWRVLAPYLRGFGPTTFRSPEQARTGDLASLAQDALDLAAALGIERFAAVGHDWGARAAYIAACAAPERVSSCVGMSVGWGTNDPNQTLGLRQIQNYWYHWYMALDRGADLVVTDRREFTRYILDLWAVRRKLDEAEFSRLAGTFENADWAEVVLHSYRVRWGLATPDPAYAALAERVAADPIIRVPTMTIHGGADPCNDPSTSECKERFFTGSYRREALPGVGHFPQWEAPEETTRLVVEHLGRRRAPDRRGRARLDELRDR